MASTQSKTLTSSPGPILKVYKIHNEQRSACYISLTDVTVSMLTCVTSQWHLLCGVRWVADYVDYEILQMRLQPRCLYSFPHYRAHELVIATKGQWNAKQGHLCWEMERVTMLKGQPINQPTVYGRRSRTTAA